MDRVAYRIGPHGTPNWRAVVTPVTGRRTQLGTTCCMGKPRCYLNPERPYGPLGKSVNAALMSIRLCN